MLKFEEVQSMINLISNNIDKEGTLVCLYVAVKEPTDKETLPSCISIVGSINSAAMLIHTHMKLDPDFKEIIETAINIDRIIPIEL